MQFFVEKITTETYRKTQFLKYMLKTDVFTIITYCVYDRIQWYFFPQKKMFFT